MKNKETFTTSDKDGKSIELAVLMPTGKQIQKANVIASQTFAQIIENGLLRIQLEDVLRSKNIWNDDKQKKLEDLQASLIASERQLLAGGIKISEAKDIAIQMWRNRAALRDLLSERNSLDNMTVEGQCENAKFNYLVAVCTVYNDTGKLYFNSYEEYLDRTDEIAAGQAAIALMGLMYNIEDDVSATLPENKFLKQYGYINDKYQLINSKGQLVDISGRLIDENGRYINEDGEFVDINGNKVDIDGNPIIEHKPFLNDNGDEIVDNLKQEIEQTKPKRQYKKKQVN